eukprot:CAMPEP_0114507328 /NCGR_PEP_ID=MMETSP0109-20121206/11948_1 /TAXON_ID=29199 /ORGANISM="Chlorarachnion reptans, Strain CCCM449" /LENGTH=270 /DNA_ID=CAMNT_0001686067 /DNA_START=747 /DNA_END=1559 /DNA_ORIENTATION=-
MLIVSGSYLFYLWDYDKLRTMSHLAAEYAQLADKAEEEAEELGRTNKEAQMVVEKFQEENKELSENLEKFKSQMNMMGASQEELDKIERQMDALLSANQRLRILEKSFNKDNAYFILKVKQDELDQKRHRALNEVMEAFDDVDNRDNDGALQGRELDNMKRLVARLPSLTETYTTDNGETKRRMAFDIDWKKIDANNDGKLSKWEFRSAMDLILSDHFNILNGVHLEEAKKSVSEFSLGEWWKDPAFIRSNVPVGNWWLQAPPGAVPNSS